MELTLGRAGVGSAEVLMTVVLGGAPAEVVIAPTRGLLLLCSTTGVLEEGGVCLGAGVFTLVGGCVKVCDIGLTLAMERDCEFAGGVEFKPGSCAVFEVSPGMVERSAVDGPSRVGRSILVTSRSSGSSSRYGKSEENRV